MTIFEGFPGGYRKAVGIPNLFFTAVLPVIDDIAELKVTLALFWRLSWKKGQARYVTAFELRSDLDLMSSLTWNGHDTLAELTKGLELAVARGTFLRLPLDDRGTPHDAYFLNSPDDRVAIEKIEGGQIDIGAVPRPAAAAPASQSRNIFGLYEDNIGPLAPIIAEELKQAEILYPESWVLDAFKEAVRLNHRSWRYIERILENWKAEGRSGGYGRPGGNTQETPATQRHDAGRPGGYIVRRKS